VELSSEMREALEKLPTAQLISIFEPAFREHLKQRTPGGNVDELMENIKRDTNRDMIMKLVALLPSVMAGLKESRPEPMQSQPQDVQMEIFPHSSPLPPYEVNPTVNIPSQPNLPSSTVTRNLALEPQIPPRESTVLRGIYAAGKGKNKTAELGLDVSETDYVRALAWTRRNLAFE